MPLQLSAPLLFDGAFGTYYLTVTGDRAPCELGNLTNSEAVLKIHKAYVAAGAQAIKTNTFVANPVQIPDPQKLRRVITAGWGLAGEAAAAAKVPVYADIGGNDAKTAEEDYLTVAGLFLELGAKHFLFETIAEYTPLLPAIRRIRAAVPDAVILVSFAVSQDGFTQRGLHYKPLLAAAMQNPAVDGAGLNCVCGPSHMVHLVQALDPMPKPLVVMPNAGYPSYRNGRIIFEDNADYFARKMETIYESGATILGGCCGTTPNHIRLLKQMLEAPRPSVRQEPEELPEQYLLEGQAAAGPHKPIAVELDPPLDADCTFILSAATQLKACGADLITVADSPLSRTRADSIMTAAKIYREVGIPAMPHISCRDKNRIALRAGLLGASFEGLRHVLAVTGDPMPASDRAGGVFSFNSFNLISFISGMNQEVFQDTPIEVGGALNINALNFSAELDRARRKLDRGASMLFSQPIFSDQAVENFLRARRELDCRLYAGILPVAGYKNAVFLLNEVSGIEIPDQVIQSLKDKNRQESAEISIQYSLGILRRVYDAADGIYIMTPLRRVDIVQGLIHEIGRLGK